MMLEQGTSNRIEMSTFYADGLCTHVSLSTSLFCCIFLYSIIPLMPGVLQAF